MTPKILCCDGYNLLYRARSGFTAGDNPVTYNFFRGFRALVEKFKPTRIYFVLEGEPKARLTKFPSYKANREKPTVGTQKYNDYQNYVRQRDFCIDLLSSHFPVSVMRHPDFECDDVIYNLVKDSVSSIDWTIISTDTDFTQLLAENKHVSLYNPVAKTFVPATHYDYVKWKALRGDPSDNIDGVPGVGDKTAYSLVTDSDALEKFLEIDNRREIFDKNVDLISFERWTPEQAMKTWSSNPVKDWNAVKEKFDELLFKSMTNEKAWKKFIETFDEKFISKAG